MRISNYKYQYWQFAGWSLTISLFIQLIIPLIRSGNDHLLLAGQSPVVSIISAQRLLTQHPFLSLLILIWVLILSWLAELILISWLRASQEIFQGQFSLANLFHDLGQMNLKKWLIKWPATMLTLIVMLPVISLAFRTPLMINGRLMVMILDYGFRLAWLPILAVLIYGGCCYLSLRCFYVLPRAAAETSKEIYDESWKKTRGQSAGKLLGKILKSLLIVLAISWLVNLTILAMQALFDCWGWQARWLLSSELWIMMAVAAFCLLAWLAVLVKLGIDNPQPRGVKVASKIYIMGALAWLALAGWVSWQYFPPLDHMPVLIAHRGVAEKDGVQNTLPAMERTQLRDHPDFVEIDIHESRDGRFIVLHDENLQKLTGLNRRPRQLDLDRMTTLRGRENGYQARLDSFNRYLATANAKHQRLLVEIKTTAADSPHVWQRFAEQYGHDLKKHGHLIQSMDAGVIKQLKKDDPSLRPFYIQAYNVGGPDRHLPAFNVEYSSLNRMFIHRAHAQQQLVYVWTVNNPRVAKELFFQQADGLVTDRLAAMRTALKEARNHAQGSQRLWYVINPVPNWGSWHDRQ